MIVSQLKQASTHLPECWQGLAICYYIGLLGSADIISPQEAPHYDSKRRVTDSGHPSDLFNTSMSAKAEFRR